MYISQPFFLYLLVRVYEAIIWGGCRIAQMGYIANPKVQNLQQPKQIQWAGVNPLAWLNIVYSINRCGRKRPLPLEWYILF